MTHLNYHQVQAQTHFELGYKLSHLFKESYLEKYPALMSKAASRTELVLNSQSYLRFTQESFPHYIEELKGYANGLGIEFGNFWLTYLYEAMDTLPEKCTSCFSSDGMIIGHNEDNNNYLIDRVSILEKTIQGLTTFELYYSHSLGGDACTINSHGYVQTINTLHHGDTQVGVPSNIIARWISETKNPKKDYEEMETLTRSAGYSHTLGNAQGEVLNIESTAKSSQLVQPSLPFVHTNHYLGNLSKHENMPNYSNSIERYNFASKSIHTVKTAQDMMGLLENVTNLPSDDSRASKTLGRMVFDLREKVVWCWLARESSQGWIKYPISFL